MTAEQLRNSILQEAISGRLVPQDPNDEPASVLLQRIREEKARLVKEGKLKKKDLVETPIKEEEIPFEIPESWEWVRIRDICSIVNGFTPRRTEPKFWTNGTINWFTVEDINKQGEVIRYTEQKITEAATSEDRIVRPGSVLLCCTASVGRCAITTVPVTTNQQFNALTVKEEFRKAVSDTYILTIAKTLAPTLHQLAGQTTFEFVSVTKVGNIVIPIPPLAEQKRIVAKLEELLPIVEQYGKAQKELDELNAALPARLRQSILQEAIHGKLVPQNENDEPVDILFNHIQEEKLKLIKQNIIRKKEAVINAVKEDEIPFDIPSSWKWCHLEELVAILDGYRKPVSKHDREVGTYPYYGANGVLDYVRDYIFDGEYLLVGEDGSVITSYGNPIVNKSSGKIWVNNHAHVLQECGKLGYYDYLFYALQAISIKKYIHGFMPKYSQGDLRKTMIPLPPLAEQQRIVAKIEELFEQIDKISK